MGTGHKDKQTADDIFSEYKRTKYDERYALREAYDRYSEDLTSRQKNYLFALLKFYETAPLHAYGIAESFAGDDEFIEDYFMNVSNIISHDRKRDLYISYISASYSVSDISGNCRNEKCMIRFKFEVDAAKEEFRFTDISTKK